jgi:uncharacterized protein YnzC (UPF0291/DUF896 family)
LGIVLPSADEYAANNTGGTGDFTLLPPDDYLVEVKEIIIQKDQVDIYSKETPQRVRDTLQVRCKVISFANGDTLLDENGDDVTDERLLFAFVDPTRVGLIPQPSFARKFFAACLGIDMNERIEFDSYNDLLGKRLIAVTIIKPNGKGVKKNKVIDFRPIRRRPQRKSAEAQDPKADAAAKLADVDLTAKAKEIFEDDLPF